MSALGNYIHLSWMGYYGRVKNKNQNQTILADADNVIKTYRHSIEQRADKYNISKINSRAADLAKMENWYNNFHQIMSTAGTNKSQLTQSEQEKYQAIKQQVTKIWQSNHISSTISNYAHLSVEKESRFKGITLNATRLSVSGKTMALSTIEDRLIPIQNAIADLNRIIKNMSDGKGKQELTIEKDKIEALYNQCLTQLNNISKYIKVGSDKQESIYDSSIRKKHTAIYMYVSNLYGNIDNKPVGKMFNQNLNLIDSINALISYFSTPNSQAIGDLLEIEAAVVGQFIGKSIESITMDEINKAVAKAKGKITWVGKQSGYGVVLNKSDELSTDQLKLSSTATQNKVDCLMTYNNHTYKISAKNYNFKGNFSKPTNITLHAGNLYSLLESENHDFINHWLNLTLQHPLFPDSPSYYSAPGVLGRAREANKLIQQALVLKALTGDGIRKASELGGPVSNIDTAEVLLLNDNATGRVRFVDMGSVFAALIANMNVYCTFENFPDFSTIGFLKKDSATVQQRLEKILGKLHAGNLKISAQIGRAISQAI